MMKKIKYVLFTSVLLGICSITASAASTCPGTTLYEEKQRVSELKVDYEAIENNDESEACLETCIDRYLLITLHNVPQEITVDVKSLNDTFKKFSLTSEQRNDDNEIQMKDADATSIKRYEFTIKSASKDCYGETLKTLTLNTPMFNEYSDVASCSTHPDFKYCSKYVNFDISTLTNEEFTKSFEKYLEEKESENKKEDNTLEEAKELVSKYWYIAIILVIILVGIIITIIITKKRKKSVI